MAEMNALAAGVDFVATNSERCDSEMSSDRIRVRPLVKGTSVTKNSLKVKKAFDD